MDTILFLEIDTIILIVVLLFGSITIVRQGSVGVTTLFGRFRRVLRPGLHFRVPFVESVNKRMSLQLRSAELEFAAITGDQANVDFKALIIYAVRAEDDETIKRAAFRFIDERSLMQAIVRSIEGSIRAYVATKKQAEVLGLRREIVDEVNAHIEVELNDWGFHLINLQINDISFDEAIMRSMAQVVATNNMKAAAENEAQAQFVSKTKVADAQAYVLRALAQAEKDADQLKGEGNALHRKQVAAGLAEAGKILEANGVDATMMLYANWLETMKSVAASSHGNLLSFDGSIEGFEKTIKQMALLARKSEATLASAADAPRDLRTGTHT